MYLLFHMGKSMQLILNKMIQVVIDAAPNSEVYLYALREEVQTGKYLIGII
jgi:hypothetical protein